MDTQTYSWVSENAPWLLIVIVVVSIVGWILRILNDWSPLVKKLLGPLGRHWAEKSARRFIRSGADYENMNKQILYLYGRVTHLEYEEQLNHTFRIEDETWHRKVDLKFAGSDDIPRRRTYDEFRAEYERLHPYRRPEVNAADL